MFHSFLPIKKPGETEETEEYVDLPTFYAVTGGQVVKAENERINLTRLILDCITRLSVVVKDDLAFDLKIKQVYSIIVSVFDGYISGPFIGTESLLRLDCFLAEFFSEAQKQVPEKVKAVFTPFASASSLAFIAAAFPVGEVTR